MTIGPRLKDLGCWSSGGTPPRDREELWEGDLPWISAKDFHHDALRPPTTFITEEAAERHSRIAPADSLVFIVRGMALAHGLQVAQTTHLVAFNQDLRALAVAPRVVPRYVYYAVRGNRYRLGAHIDRAAHGTARVSESVLSERLRMAFYTEQQRIATFLDRECERIADLLRALDELPPALDEAQRRLIDDLFDAPTVRLGRVATVQTGLTLGGVYDHGTELVTRPYLRVANVLADRIDIGDLATVSVPLGVAVRTTLRPGDVLMTEGGDIDKLGRGAVWDGRIDGCLHQNHVFAVRCAPRLLPEVLAAWTRGSVARSYFEGTASRITNIASTNLTKLLRLPVPDLKPDEQSERFERFQIESERLGSVQSEIDATRSLLAEYRDALITEAVTGKLDVTRLSEQQMDESAHAAIEGERPEVLSA